MQTILSVNNIFFTVLGYPMSYIEFFGTLFNILCVYLVAKNRISNWPIGIIGTVLFAFLFLQINLYADFFEQIYYFITGFWGWWMWSKMKQKHETEETIIVIKKQFYIWWAAGIVAGTIILGYITAHLNIYLPQLFTESASFPYLDSFTTILSFAATIMLIRKEAEAWYLWIVVDIIGIALYWVKGVHLISLLYVVFLVLAIQGLVNWSKIYKKINNK